MRSISWDIPSQQGEDPADAVQEEDVEAGKGWWRRRRTKTTTYR